MPDNKSNRQLYVGNLPANLSVTKLMEMLNLALLAMGKYRKDLIGNPIVSCWISTDGHFAFVEFRSVEDMEMGFALNQCSIFGRSLRIGRTKHSQTGMKPAQPEAPEEVENKAKPFMLKINGVPT